MQIQGRSLGSFVLAVFTVFLLLGSGPGRAQELPKPGPEQKKLEVWVGRWKYEGTSKQSPFGPAARFKGTQTGRMVLNGFFLETRWKDKGETGYIGEGIGLQGYDAAKKSYVDYGFDNEGVASPAVTTVQGNTWTSISTRPDDAGKVYNVRFIATFSADGRTVVNTAEYSADNGQTWRLWWELTMKKR